VFASILALGATVSAIVTTQVGKAVSQWRNEAAHFGLSRAEVERMASAFDHPDLRTALGK
jgi:hypothetical protein